MKHLAARMILAAKTMHTAVAGPLASTMSGEAATEGVVAVCDAVWSGCLFKRASRQDQRQYSVVKGAVRRD